MVGSTTECGFLLRHMLRHMYPEFRIPVMRLRFRPQKLYKLAQASAPFRRENLLVLGSGGIVHNLRIFREDLSISRRRHGRSSWMAGLRKGWSSTMSVVGCAKRSLPLI